MSSSHVCEACRQKLSPEVTVVVVRQQGVTQDARGSSRSIDVGSPLFFHEQHWHGGASRTRYRVEARGTMETVAPPG